ncbi:Hsp70 protein-domain-containing protein [Pelagophyceae sp. CCMP2097]|nr:Hsp70 protein-domain-containing protein [Pelagophyceae sp. CCMP2097]
MLRALVLWCLAAKATGLSAGSLSVGIDLGTSRSCVAIVDATGREPRVLANENGELTTASVLDVDGREVVSWKRAIGLSAARARSRLSRDFALQLRLDLSDESAEAEVEMITGLGGEGRLAPSDASTMLLRKLVADASARLGAPVGNAVIGVPAMFDESQRAATKKAAQAAGLDKVLLVPEPELAAHAYGVGRTSSDKDALVLVFDLGGGTLDVSILQVGGRTRTMEIISTRGDACLGGLDFTQAVADLALKKSALSASAAGKLDGADRAALFTNAEAAKVSLSTADGATIRVPKADPPTVQVSRAELEIAVTPLLQRCERLVRECAILVDVSLRGDPSADLRNAAQDKLREKRLQKGKKVSLKGPGKGPGGKGPAQPAVPTIESVVLVGAATKMPAVTEFLARLCGVSVETPVDPEHAVALGAATRAAMNDGLEDEFVVLSQWKAEILRAVAAAAQQKEANASDRDVDDT